MSSFGGSLSLTMSGKRGGQRPLRVVANLTRANYAQDTTTAGNEMRQVRAPHYVAQATREIWLVYATWWLDLGAGGREVANGNGVTLGAALEYNGTTVVAPNASAFAMPDDTTFLAGPFKASAFGLSAFPAGAAIFSRTVMTVTVGQKIPRAGQYLSEAPASRLNSAAGANQLSGTGLLTGQNNQPGPAPIMVIGRTLSPAVSLMEIGDSIGEGQNDSNQFPSSNNAGGIYQRGAWNANKTAIAQIGRHGGQLSRLSNGTPAEGSRRRALYKYATHLIFHFGANDLFDPTTYASWKALLVAEIAIARAAGVKHITVAGISPRTSSTDSWATTANQSPQASWDPTKSATANADLAARGPGNDAFFDVNVDFGDQGAAAKWVVTGAANFATPEGTHPQTAVVTPAGVRFTTLIGTFQKY